ncbi:MAG: FAD-dependent oxidoreductase [Gallionellaceae bacterium]
MSARPIVIIGSGLAGISVLRELRKLDREVAVTVITGDDGAFYAKPNLSNAFALSKNVTQLVQTTAAQLSKQLNARFLTQTQAQAIRTDSQVVETSAGEQPYGKLVLAVGAHPIRLPLQGDAAHEVLSVNHLADYAVFRERLAGKRWVAILGAGLIGCEFANDLRTAGFEVEIFDLAPQPLGHLLPLQAAAFLRTKLESIGIRFHLQRSVISVDARGSETRLTDDQGLVHSAELVLSAVGLRPATELAATAGLQVNRGIVVDEYLRNSAEDVFALGHCAEVQGLVLPFVQPILHAARALAKNLKGEATALHYPVMPVVVKTPACPAVVCPPPQGASGRWLEKVSATGVHSLFLDAEQRLLGFALVGGETVKDRNALAGKVATT